MTWWPAGRVPPAGSWPGAPGSGCAPRGPACCGPRGRPGRTGPPGRWPWSRTCRGRTGSGSGSMTWTGTGCGSGEWSAWSAAGRGVAWPAGEAEPDAVVLNDGDLTYAGIEFDERTLAALAQAAMDVGDPLTEAVCWNAAWQMVTGGALAGPDFAGLVTRRLGGRRLGGRRLGGPGFLPVPGLEVLLERAVSCADQVVPPGDRRRLRSRLPQARLYGAVRAATGSPEQRALASGFAASAYDDGQLDRLRSWLAGGLAVDAGLRGRILRTLAERGIAADSDLDALISLDPVDGQQHRATCRASRPDTAAKEEAWTAALADQDWRMAQAYATRIWVAGQEELLGGYLG